MSEPAHGVRRDAMPRPCAVVHEWIGAYAGSEQVFEALAGLLPNADLFALSADPRVQLQLGGRSVRTTFLDLPSLRRRRGVTLPAMPLAWAMLGRRRYDTVITSHHCMAVTNRLAAKRHLVYVHSPVRYLWNPEIDDRASYPPYAPVRVGLRRLERRAARRADSVAANSQAVARRVETHWGLEARVIYPPVAVSYFADRGEPSLGTPLKGLPADFLLSLGRWIPYKGHDLAVRAAEAAGLPLVIAGQGPSKGLIQRMASSARVPVIMIESPERPQVRYLMQRAYALLFAAVEDFGIVPVEAQAAGLPVIAMARGGVTETIVDGRTGFLLESWSEDELKRAVAQVDRIAPEDCVRNAERFSHHRFASEVREWLSQA